MKTAITPADIAKNYHWDGEWIFAAMCEALTEANFHGLRARLESSFADWLYEEQQRERAERAAA
jgi:hypothetical protein